MADLRTWDGSLGPTMTDRDVARRDSLFLAIAWLTGFLAVGAMLLVSFVVDPVAVEDGRIRLTPQCSSQRWLGHPCPSCGLTRAFLWMSHGEVGRARAHHGSIVVLYPGSWMFLLFAGAGLVRAAREHRRLGTWHEETKRSACTNWK